MKLLEIKRKVLEMLAGLSDQALEGMDRINTILHGLKAEANNEYYSELRKNKSPYNPLHNDNFNNSKEDNK